jgi:membrane dipeptidase
LFVRVPTGLEDVSKYPDLFAALLEDGWSEEDLAKVAGGNILRVMEKNEEVGYVLIIKV